MQKNSRRRPFTVKTNEIEPLACDRIIGKTYDGISTFTEQTEYKIEQKVNLLKLLLAPYSCLSKYLIPMD